MVMEAGRYRLDDGTEVEAGRVTLGNTYPMDNFAKVSFSESFGTVPVVATSVMTHIGPDAVVTRNRSVGETAFQVAMQHEEANSVVHAEETVGYIAWEAGSGELSGHVYEVGDAGSVTHQWQTITYGPFADVPVLIVDMQSTNGGDTANLRWTNREASGVEVQVDEEQSANSETGHVEEQIGFFGFVSSGNP